MNNKTLAVPALFAAFAILLFSAQNSVAEQSDPIAGERAIEEILVTGSRIKRKDLEGASPVQIFTRSDIARAGAVNIGDILREIPSVSGQAQTTQVNNGGTGAKRISLRGLGSERTLVLINGRRVVGSGQGSSSTGLQATVDLNTIPVSFIENIEVLKDGASAVYGSDAVAGVVNIITRKDFQGIEFAASRGETSESDGEQESLSLTFGNSSENGYFIFNAEYVDEGLINCGSRSWCAPARASIGGEVQAFGSSAPPWGRFTGFEDNANVLGGGAFGDAAAVAALFPGGATRGPEVSPTFRDFSFATDTFDFAPSNHQRQPTQRYLLSFNAGYNLDNLSGSFLGDITAFTEMSYINRESDQRTAEVPLAPLAFFGFDAPYSAENFYNPFGVDITDWRRRMVEGGSRTELVEQETKRIVIGLQGETEKWNWELAYTFGETDASYNAGDFYNLQRVANAVGPTTGSPATGDLQCVNEPANCVPLDVFTPGVIDQAALDYVTFRSNESGGQEQDVWSFNIANSELFNLPAGPVGFAFGIEHREEEGFDTPDSQIQALAASGAVTGTPRFATAGDYEVDEFFVEFHAPLLSDLPLVESLDLTLAHRYSDYDIFGSTNNTSFGLLWRPHPDLLIRGKFSEAFRAPSISDLFGGAGTSFPSLADPCAQNATAFCIADGVPAAGYVPISTQISTRVGGSSDTQPESADTFTAGFVWTPSFVEWAEPFAITVDYYDVELENAISSLGADFILSSCATSGENCELINRFTDATNAGNVRSVDNRTTNVGGIDTSGVDVGITYSNLDTPIGQFDFRLETTYIIEYDKELADGSSISHAGRFIDDQDGFFGRVKYSFDVGWSFDNWYASYNLRYISEADERFEDFSISNPDRADGLFDRTIEDITYHDIQVGYNFEDYGLNVVVGVDNATDEDPPLSLDGFNDQTDVRTFDTAGRYWYVRLNYAFDREK